MLEYQLRNQKFLHPYGIIIQLDAKENDNKPRYSSVTIIDPNKLEVEVLILTDDILDIKESMPVEMTLENSNEELITKGKVKEIAAYAQENISALGLEEQRIKVTITPESSKIPLKPGYALEDITTYKEENCISVPKTSLFTYKGKDALG